jgi:hypothetical protein
MVTMLENCSTEEQRSVVRFFFCGQKNSKDIHKEIFIVCGEKCSSRKAVHN